MEWILTGEDLTNEESALPSPTCDDTPLESEEADLVAMFRLLPSYEREDLFDLVYFKYKKHVEKKMESIYWTYKEDRLKRKSAAADDGNPSGIA